MKRHKQTAAGYAHLEPFVGQIPDIFDRQGEEIYRQRNVIKVFEAPDGTRLNAKRYHIPALPNRIVYSIGLRKPKAQRAFVYPQRLLSKGIDTPAPVALIEERGSMGLLGYSYFISLQCDYGHTLYEVGNARPGQYEELAVALARFAADMHEKGVLHKDFTPGNILWKRDSQGFHFSIVDINRMRFGPVSVEQGLDNMKRLWGPKAFFELLIRTYAAARRYSEQAALERALPARARFWKRFSKKHNVPFTLEL